MESGPSYRQILKDEFAYRTEQNNAYSLRAFARDLSIQPSQLSEILNGKVGLGGKKSLEIAKKLGLNEKDSQLFKALVEKEHGRSQQIKEHAQNIVEFNEFSDNFTPLSDDTFKPISDWYHFAILSTMELDHYDGTLEFIVNQLGLTISEVEEAIKRFLKLDVVDIKDGKFIKAKDFMPTTTHNIPSNTLKRFHKQHLQKSMSIIDEVAVELRDITTMTMTMDLSRMKEAKELIKEFRRNFCKIMETGNKKQVYNLNIQFIPLTKTDHL